MCISDFQEGIRISVRVTPRASKNMVVGRRGDSLAVKLTSPPVEGRANRDLVKFLAKMLGVSTSSVSIVKGETSRNKILFVAGLDSRMALTKLGILTKE
jgi:uncharacterized protein